jgi:hypothetical protein
MQMQGLLITTGRRAIRSKTTPPTQGRQIMTFCFLDVDQTYNCSSAAIAPYVFAINEEVIVKRVSRKLTDAFIRALARDFRSDTTNHLLSLRNYKSSLLKIKLPGFGR